MSGDFGVFVVLFVALYFEVFLLITFFEKRPARRNRAEKLSYYPSTTIIVPCLNEERTLKATVDSLLALEYPKEKLFISIVDDGSTDRTLEIARTYEEDSSVKVFSKENGGKYTALNLGITQSTAELVGCLDADSFVAPDALLEIVKRFNQNAEVMAVIPSIKVYKPKGMFQYMQAAEYTFGIFYKKMFETLSAIPVLPGPFSIYRKEVFARIGLFRHAYNTEDMEMALRMQSKRMVIENAHTAHVYTVTPRTLGGLVKQRTRWSQGFLQNSKDYWFMYGNPRYEHLGIFVLPFGLVSIFSGLYLAGYMLFQALDYLGTKAFDMAAIGFVPSLSLPELTWFYLNTSSMTLLIITIILCTILLITLGKRMSESVVGFRHLISYLALYGFVAPIWLAKAVFGAARGTLSAWR